MANQFIKFCHATLERQLKLQGTLPKGAHVLGFCAIGCPTEIYHQAFISNIIIY